MVNAGGVTQVSATSEGWPWLQVTVATPVHGCAPHTGVWSPLWRQLNPWCHAARSPPGWNAACCHPVCSKAQRSLTTAAARSGGQLQPFVALREDWFLQGYKIGNKQTTHKRTKKSPPHKKTNQTNEKNGEDFNRNCRTMEQKKVQRQWNTLSLHTRTRSDAAERHCLSALDQRSF